MKAFTFLGKGTLHTSNYIFDNQECETQFFAEAIVQFFSPESLYIFATKSAAREPVSKDNKSERLSYIKDLLRERTNVRPIDIKEGSDETELWDIFGTVVDNIDDNDTVLFDITHGFRSLPFLTFLALAYVSNVKSDVNIEKVIYGAYDAVDWNNPDKPVFDLTPFVSLLKWMNAVNVFQNSGDARPIAELDVPSNIAKALTGLSEALLTNRTLEAQSAAATFDSLSFDESQAPPFQMLVNQLKQSYKQMAVDNPTEPEQSLKAQYQQIKWYVGNQHYLQAITLMREWLISYECLLNEGSGHWLSKNPRDKAEDDLNDSSRQRNRQLAEALRQTGLANQDSIKTELWTECNEIRRDLAHCGMRQTPENAARAIQRIRDLFSEFKDFVKSIGYV